MMYGSTASVTLKLTIPQIPHIHVPFILSTVFDHDPTVPEICLHVWNRLLALEKGSVAELERVGIYSQQPANIPVLQAHPEQLSAHSAIEQVQITVHCRCHCDVVEIPIP